jgi:AraC-like DNA-binding protein
MAANDWSSQLAVTKKNGTQNLSRTRRRAGVSEQAKLATTVRHAIQSQLATPSAHSMIVVVAENLSINVRTLQRRLASAGTSFRDLLSECRRQKALRELAESDRPVGDVSLRLGYSDPAHFARAFRRWTGSTPIEYRRSAWRQDDNSP